MKPAQIVTPTPASRGCRLPRLLQLHWGEADPIEHVEQALAGKPPLVEQQVLALAQALNSVRLVLGTMLDVSEDHDPDDVADDDPMVGEYHLYGFLSWLLEWTVRSLSGT